MTCLGSMGDWVAGQLSTSCRDPGTAAHPSCHSNRYSNTGPGLFRNFGLAQDGTTRHCLFLTQVPRQGATEQI